MCAAKGTIMNEWDMRAAIATAYRTLHAEGLVVGSAGNISARLGEDMLITPSGAAPATADAATMVRMTLAEDPTGRPGLKPSSEWRFHRDIYRARAEARAVVHTHSPYCTAFALLRRGLPAAHYMLAAFGGADVRCTDYAPYGTQELSDLVVEALEGRNAVLLGSHGMIVIGGHLGEATARAVELEALAKTIWLAQAIGQPVLLPDEEMQRTVERFRTYGRRAQDV
jgi:L-fuculose-phosphate aldolase